MPTYEYACKGCDHTFEVYQSMRDDPLRKCPSCGRLRLKRLIGTGAGLIFKGTGFYQTDYKKATAPVGESESSHANGTGQSEAKPEGQKKSEGAKSEGGKSEGAKSAASEKS